MALDPRLSLIPGANQDTGKVVRDFQNALLSITGDDPDTLAREKSKISNQLLQTRADTSALNLGEARNQQRLGNIAQTSLELQAPLQRAMQSGDITEVDRILTNRIANLQARQQAGENVDATESVEALQQLRTQGPQALFNTTNDVINVARQTGVLANQQGGGVQSSAFIPGKGFAVLDKSGSAGFVPVEGVGETSEQKREADIQASARKEQQKALLQGKTSAVKQAIVKGGQAFDRIQPISTAINNYDEAIAAIDEGAETGVIDSMLPSFRKASIELDNVVKRLGLDVVGNTTFGALSESELAFALKAAVPDNLQPAELREWLIAKRDAQKKVKARVEEAASFLSDGTHTLKDWVEFDKARQLNRSKQPAQQAPQTTQQAGGIKFLGFE